MKKVLLGIIVIALIVIYTKKNNVQEEIEETNTENVEETSDNTTIGTVVKESFLLDELLAFNSEAALKEAYPEDVTRSTGYYPEGMGEYQNTLLFEDTPNEVEFIWEDDTIGFTGLVFVTITGTSTEWKTVDGITIGTTLKELEVLNEQPFTFYGFGWDYGGLTGWDDGYLSTRNVSVVLALPEDPDPDKYEGLWGDIEMTSDLEIAQKANPFVTELSLSGEEE